MAGLFTTFMLLICLGFLVSFIQKKYGTKRTRWGSSEEKTYYSYNDEFDDDLINNPAYKSLTSNIYHHHR